MSKKKTRKNYMEQATELHSMVVRERDGRCLAAGAYDITCKGYLQCCHIIPRGELSIRTREDNAIAMCQSHHMFFTPRVATWLIFIEDRYPGRETRLRGLVRQWYEAGCPKVDWQGEVVRLKGILERLAA